VLGMRGEVVAFALGAFLLSLYAHRNDLMRLISGQEVRANEAVSKFLSK